MNEIDVSWAAGLMARPTTKYQEETMRKLTTAERQARALAVVAESDRTGCGTIEAIKRVNARMFSETARRAPVTATVRQAAGKPLSKRGRRIAAMVQEALTAAAAPRPDRA